MKPICLLAGLAGITTFSVLAEDSTPQLIEGERGPHHAVWQRVTSVRAPDGGMSSRTNAGYVALGTGMHFLENGEWKPSRAEIEIVQGFAVARQGPHQVIFEANLNSPGAVDLLTPDGKRLVSNVLGLAYRDRASGDSVMVASVRDCAGAVLAPNQVYYMDAFEADGGAVIDVRYTYTASGLEQDLVIVRAPPSPAAYGMDGSRTVLEVWSEFLSAPEPQVKQVVLRLETDPAIRNAWAEPDLIDAYLDFGAMKIGRGYAFSLESDDPFENRALPTGKSFEVVEGGRRFLIEKIDYGTISSYLSDLPQAAALNPPGRAPFRPGPRLLARRSPPPAQGPRWRWQPDQFAKVDLNRKGFVLDYSVLNGSLTNVTLRGDTTYFVTNLARLYGTTVIQPGAVVKHEKHVPGEPAKYLEFNGPIQCLTYKFHPAVFTAKDDDSVGSVIDGSTGFPSGSYAYYGLFLDDSTTAFDLHDLRIRHAFYGMAFDGANKATNSHIQIGNVSRGFGYQGNCNLAHRNFLIHDATYAFYKVGSGQTNSGEHGTVHRAQYLRNSTNDTLFLTNSLLISVTNNLQWSGSNVETNLSDAGVFASAGAGSRYLSEESPYRNIGTTNIDAGLLSDIRKRTTYAPLLLTNRITVDTLLTPQAPRDGGEPDLGFHYDCVDVIARSVTISNCTLTVSNGTTVGIDFDATNYGIRLDYGAKLLSQGKAEDLNRFVRIHAVQEGTASSGVYHSIFRDADGVSSLPEAHFRFTDFPAVAASHLWIDEDGDSSLQRFSNQHSQFRGGTIWWGVGASNAVAGFTNNLFERVILLVNPTVPSTNYFWNNLFLEGITTLDASAATFVMKDNLFATTNLAGYGSFTNDYNAYLTNVTRLSPNAPNDVILTNMPLFLSGPLGSYYYPTNDGMLSTLIDKGSRYASNASLYHFTTLTNQTKEGTNWVDMGFHYVAVTNGVAIDTDLDGQSDYFEDVDGDGLADLWETGWQNGADQGVSIKITRPHLGNVLP